MRAWIYAACFLSVVSATSRGQGESPTASSSRKNERKPRPRIDRSSTQLSPYYHAAFQRIASVHRPYYNLETGSRSGESQYKYSAKKDFPAIQDLQSQEKTLADRRKSQLFGLAHGLSLSQMLKVGEKERVKELIEREKKRLGRDLDYWERVSMYQQYAVHLGIASREWFQNRQAVHFENRAKGGLFGRQAHDAATASSPSAPSAPAPAPPLSPPQVGLKRERGATSTRAIQLGVHGEGKKERSNQRKERRPDEMNRKAKKDTKAKVPATAGHAVTLPSTGASTQQSATHDSRSGQSVGTPELSRRTNRALIWVHDVDHTHEDLYDLFSSPLVDGTPDHGHAPSHLEHDLHPIYPQPDSPRFSGAELRLPHGLEHVDFDSHQDPLWHLL